MSNFPYFPHTAEDIRQMLERIGVSSLEDLYSDVPADFLFKGEYDLPDAKSEQLLTRSSRFSWAKALTITTARL